MSSMESQSRAWLRDSQNKVMLQVSGKSSDPSGGAGLSFYAPDFALQDPEPWLIGDTVLWLDPEPQVLPVLTHRVEPSPTDFDRIYEDIMRRVGAGEFEKVVPIVHEDFRFSHPLTSAMFPRAFAEREGQFSYGFEYAGEGICGITPELLFSVDGGVLSTMALAGTGRFDGPSLLDDPKERREHQVVIDHVVRELGEFGRPEVGDTRERVYGRLKHLHTPIRMILSEQPEFIDLVRKLHPTAALGGWPRRPAVEWLERQDFHHIRRRFGAPFGYQVGGAMRCVVAIRCVQWRDADATVAAGCGVLTGSQSAREWNELKLKRASVFEQLGLPL